MPENNPLNERLRALPSVDQMLCLPALASALEQAPRDQVVGAVREALAAARARVLAGEEAAPAADALADEARALLVRFMRPSLRRVVNATGVIIHTNLGRSCLAEPAVRAVEEAARRYSTLEYDTDAMARGSRHSHCEKLLCALTGAEAAIAVNNNAAAVMLVLSEFAAGHEAVVSRGELVEIGGSFRIPDIMALSGAVMVGVGTTNKTHPADYERAISPDTAMLLKVHTSNYRVVGFTETVEASQMRGIADAAVEARRAVDPAAPGIIVYEDLGSGALIRPPALGSQAEPTAGEALDQGCDLVSFSGDKLLGGPQAGIVIGRRELIARLKANPMVRALRLDKMTLAALEATLRLYLEPERALAEIPTLALLSEPAGAVRERAERLAGMLAEVVGDAGAVSVVDEASCVGGGTLPLLDIPSSAAALSFRAEDGAQRCEEHLIRRAAVPVVGRIRQGQLLFDARTLADDELPLVAEAVAEALGARGAARGGEVAR